MVITPKSDGTPRHPLTCNLKIAMQAGKPTMYQVHFTWLIASHRTQWAASIEEAFFQTCRWLNQCTRNGITLNPKKFQFPEDTVEFAGITVTSTNIKPSTKFLNSIQHFPTPTDILGARAWFGIYSQPGSLCICYGQKNEAVQTPFETCHQIQLDR